MNPLTIKQWLNNVRYDPEGQMILGENMRRIADLRGWGELQNIFKLDMNAAAKFQDQIGEFIVDAINEKLKRDETAAIDKVLEGDGKFDSVCGVCNGEGWINFDIETVPCPNCGGNPLPAPPK